MRETTQSASQHQCIYISAIVNYHRLNIVSQHYFIININIIIIIIIIIIIVVVASNDETLGISQQIKTTKPREVSTSFFFFFSGR